jgi:carboxypeptidase C (cathepsin A)
MPLFPYPTHSDYHIVLNSGHMMPMDLPQVAYEMISAFVENRALNQGSSKIGEQQIDPTAIDCIDTAVSMNNKGKKSLRGRRSEVRIP